jgi:hypothetical protein
MPIIQITKAWTLGNTTTINIGLVDANGFLLLDANGFIIIDSTQ